MLNRAYFDKVFLQAIDQLRKRAPKDTGNLAYNSIKYRWINSNKFVIYVDTGRVIESNSRTKGIAPYMPFTNEEWISPKWNGKKNPNENWWNDSIEYIIKFIAKRLNGELR